eukprot:TRINITY_DN60038_c0_g1_i1.p1 TRINITY_DN60038_c0_g1~~TRINITY_DN60038_c0_g1_i1.p1  ORF type:complete len:291 (+),score=38.80 TRINITY_DN60038_c0_g1_i1:275-1147(+)
MGNVKTLELIVQKGMVDVNMRASKGTGDTPLHRAARLGKGRCIQKLLELKADPYSRNFKHMTPFQVAGGYVGKENTIEPEVRENARQMLCQEVPSLCTLVLHHPECEGHITHRGHQEAPERVRSILANLSDKPASGIRFSSDFEAAELVDVAKVHSGAYVQSVSSLASTMMGSCGTPVPFTPYVQREQNKLKKSKAKQVKISDTSFSAGSLMAALRAIGAVQHAIDQTLTGAARNAFCCVRPPGHHAGRAGLIKSAGSCGFCIFNTVALGAYHALTTHCLLYTSPSPRDS